MIFNNTTNIPDKLIAFAVGFSIEDGVVIDEIVVRNKAEGKTLGQWGWYRIAERKIILIVPQVINNFKSKRPYTASIVTLESRTEFLIMVMAHELRHAGQFQLGGAHWRGLSMNRAREINAEFYEQKMLDKFRLEYGDVQMAARKQS